MDKIKWENGTTSSDILIGILLDKLLKAAQ